MTILAGKISKKKFLSYRTLYRCRASNRRFWAFFVKKLFFDPKKFGADLALYGRNWPNSADISLNHGEHLEINFSSQQLQFKLSHKHYEAFLNFSNSGPIGRIRPKLAKFGDIMDHFEFFEFGADLAVYGRNWPSSADISLNHGGHLEISFSSQQLQFKLSHKNFEAFLNFSNLGPIWPYTAQRGRIRRLSFKIT